MHPHGADRHPGERPVAEPARDARVPHARQPEVGPAPPREDQTPRPVAHQEGERRLHVRHDAHRGSLGSMRRPSDRPTGMFKVEPPLTSRAPAPNTTAPSSGKSSVWVITRSRASTPASAAVLPGPEGSKIPPRSPTSSRPLAYR